MPLDTSLARAVNWFRSQPRMVERFGAAIRRSFDEVFDGQRTGRYSLTQLSKVEKTYIGTKVEIVIQAEFGLHRGNRMDYLVDDQEVDAKWSIKSAGWMIPTEAVGELCLCMTADDNHSTFSVGIVRADEASLRTSLNKDKKRRFNERAYSEDSMEWQGAIPNARVQGDLPGYRNVQLPEVNALAASLAVMEWRRQTGQYVSESSSFLHKFLLEGPAVRALKE